MRKYFLILLLLVSAAGFSQTTPNIIYGKEVVIQTRDTSSAELTIKNSTRNVLGYFKNIGGGKGQYVIIPQTDITGLPDSLLARYTKTQADARFKSISYVPAWLDITGKPANFTTTYALSNDIQDSILSRLPYENATRSLNMGNYRVYARGLLGDTLFARTSAGGFLATNSGSVIASFGAGGSNEIDFHGFAGYNANRASSYTSLSFVTKNDMDSADGFRNKLPVIAWGNSLTEGTGATSWDSTWPSQASRLSGYNFVNKGIAGETPAQINVRVYAESADTLLMPSVFWAMENISDTAQMTNQLDSFVNKIGHNRWVAVAPLLRSGNPVGNSAYNQQRKWTYDATRRYGNHIIDMHDWLINFGDGSSGDNTDIANRVIPRSLRVDVIHLNDKGCRIVAQRILQQLNMFTQGNQTYTNGVSISAQQGSPLINGNGLFQWKNNNHSYINSFSATTPYIGGDTLTIQNSAGTVNIAPETGSRIRTGFLPARTTPATIILTRGSNTDTAQLAYVASGQIASASAEIVVTDGANSTVNKNVDLALAVANSSPGLKGDSTTVPQFFVDSKGRVTGVTPKPILIAQSQVTNLTTNLAGKADLSGANFTGDIFTVAGEGISVGGASYAIAPSATRGVLQVNGSTDQFVNLSNNGYLFGSSSLIRLLGNSGRSIDFVTGGLRRLLIDASNGIVAADSTLSAKKLLGGSSAPSVSLGSNITGSVAVTGTDMAGTVTVTVTGASSLATLNELFTLTYNIRYGTTPHVVWSPASVNAAALLQAAGGLYLKNSDASSFQIATVNSYTTPASQTYSFTYHIIQ